MHFIASFLLRLVPLSICLIVALYNSYKLHLFIQITERGKIYVAQRIGYRHFTFYVSYQVASRHTPIYEFEIDGEYVRALAVDFYKSYSKLDDNNPLYDKIYYFDQFKHRCVIVGRSVAVQYKAFIILFVAIALLLLFSLFVFPTT